MSENGNKMREIRVEKVTVNLGVGQSGQPLENARELLKALTGRKPVTTFSRMRNPVFRIKKGDPIGVKVTLRRKAAEEFLRKALEAADNKVSKRSFDGRGNFSFGVKEYIDFPGAKYNPKIGVLGFDVCVTLSRKGARVRDRRRMASRIGKTHRITREEGTALAQQAFNVVSE